MTLEPHRVRQDACVQQLPNVHTFTAPRGHILNGLLSFIVRSHLLRVVKLVGLEADVEARDPADLDHLEEKECGGGAEEPVVKKVQGSCQLTR